jgi:hypothetical protein
VAQRGEGQRGRGDCFRCPPAARPLPLAPLLLCWGIRPQITQIAQMNNREKEPTSSRD